MTGTKRQTLPIAKIVLDLDNPRMYHHGVASGGGGSKLTDEEIQVDIEGHSETPELMKERMVSYNWYVYI